MKKIFTLAILALSFIAIPVNAQSSLKFGLKGGLNVTDMHLSSDLFEASNQAGWFVGPTIKLSLPLTGLSFDASALYDYKSAKVENELNQEQTVKQQSINIPINIRYGVGLGSLASVFAFAGPQFGFNALKKSNFSVNVGLGASLLNHLQLTANYNIACGKTADVTLVKAVENVGGQATGLKSKSRNNSWQVALAYYF